MLKYQEEKEEAHTEENSQLDKPQLTAQQNTPPPEGWFPSMAGEAKQDAMAEWKKEEWEPAYTSEQGSRQINWNQTPTPRVVPRTNPTQSPTQHQGHNCYPTINMFETPPARYNMEPCWFPQGPVYYPPYIPNYSIQQWRMVNPPKETAPLQSYPIP